MPVFTDEKKTYSLLELSRLIEDAIAQSMSDTYLVKAEISSLSVRGHCYMELVEKAQDATTIAAKVRATCWQNVWVMMSAYFLDHTGMNLGVGMQVLLEAKVCFHPVYGLSLQILGIDPSYTLGALALQRQKTIQRLQEEGVFSLQQELSLPTLPKRIAVVSSPTAAGYGDFCHQLQLSGFAFSAVLFPAIMQGDNAAASIMKALDDIFVRKEEFDIVILIRGGGATTDLSCFDNYELAFHITQLPLPVISGIGHQRDVSIADMVAFHSEKTPTATAEFLVKMMQDQQNRLDLLVTRMYASADKRLSVQKQKLQVVMANLKRVFSLFLQRQRTQLEIRQKAIEMLSPETIYQKGYSLTLHDGKVVKDPSVLSSGDTITTCLAKGTVESVVK